MAPNPFQVTKAELSRVFKLMKYLHEKKIDVDDDPWFAEKDLLLYAHEQWPHMWSVKMEQETKVALLATHFRTLKKPTENRVKSYVK